MNVAWDKINRRVVLFLIPIGVLSLYSSNKISLKRVQQVFLLSAIASILIAFSHILLSYNTWIKYPSSSNSFVKGFITQATYHNLASYVGGHALYYANYLSFATVVALQLFFNEVQKKQKKYYLLSIILLTIIVLLLQSVTIMLGFIICILLMIFSNIDFNIPRNKLIIHIISSLTITTLTHILILKLRYYNNHEFGLKEVLTFYLPSLVLGAIIPLIIHFVLKQHKVIIIGLIVSISLSGVFALKHYAEKNPSFLDYKNNYNNVNARYGKWKSALLVIKDHPWLGVGIGDSHDELMKKFHEIDFPIAIKLEYNEHNQYFRYWLVGGIPALLTFLSLIIYNLYLGYKKKDFTLICLVILLATFSITESCFARQKGAIFFITLLSIYGAMYNKQKISTKNQ
ncbi:MAG: O-antigen ligase family protein [Cytophagales bacterium]|nr:O-antigen ligase family protein [Cytophagales bacterium]